MQSNSKLPKTNNNSKKNGNRKFYWRKNTQKYTNYLVQMNQFAGQKLRHRCREQTYGHQGGKRRGGSGGGMNWEIGIDIDTLICIK